jgi:hypothetical protein
MRGMLTIRFGSWKADQADEGKGRNKEKERQRGGHAVSVLRGSCGCRPPLCIVTSSHFPYLQAAPSFIRDK